MKQAVILVVDDEALVRKGLALELSRDGYLVREAVDGLDALKKVAEERPDLILLDLNLPEMDGIEVCRKLKKDPATRLVPVVMHTSVDDIASRLRAHEDDADDYLVKGCSLLEMRARIRSLLRLKRCTDELEGANAVLATVARIVEQRDFDVSEHCQAVAHVCGHLGVRLGLAEDRLQRLRMGAKFHDIGKVGIPDSILQKPGPLDAAERATMSTHAARGADLLEPMHSLGDVVPLVRNHHERLDGTGYPDGLKGDQISLEVRVLAVADIYQALISVRPYKPAFSPEKAVEILRAECAKGWWDAAVVEALASLVSEGVLVRA